MIDFTKPLQTIDGREVDIYNKERMHGAIRNANGSWYSFSWLQDGSSAFTFNHLHDLVNVPPKIIKRRMYVTTWDENGLTVTNDPICHQIGAIITAFNFPVDIEIPEGYGL